MKYSEHQLQMVLYRHLLETAQCRILKGVLRRRMDSLTLQFLKELDWKEIAKELSMYQQPSSVPNPFQKKEQEPFNGISLS